MPDLKIDWLGPCPTCNHEGPHNVETISGTTNNLFEGDIVECGKCKQAGVIELVETGLVECFWAENDGYYCQCDHPDCGNWYTVAKIGDTCPECKRGTMQPQDVEPY